MQIFSNAYRNSLYDMSIEELRNKVVDNTKKYNDYITLKDGLEETLFNPSSNNLDRDKCRVDLLLLEKKLSIFKHDYLEELQVLAAKLGAHIPLSINSPTDLFEKISDFDSENIRENCLVAQQ